MKLKNIVLVIIVVVVVIICILGAVIGFGLNDEPKDNEKASVKLSQDLPDNDEDDADISSEETTENVTGESKNETTSQETTSKQKETEEETTTTKQKETETETTTSAQNYAEADTTTAVQAERLDRWSYEYMMIDGRSVYSEYNVKLMELYDSINKERINAGKSALAFDAQISYIACARASLLVYEDAIEDSSNTKYYEFMKNSGITFSLAAENIAAGHESAGQVVSGSDTSWKTSTTHYDNMISDKYTKVGVGVDYSESMGYVWVAIFSN